MIDDYAYAECVSASPFTASIAAPTVVASPVCSGAAQEGGDCSGENEELHVASRGS